MGDGDVLHLISTSKAFRKILTETLGFGLD
jgi:hypothetical protein